MARPTNSIKQIQSPSDTFEIIPRRLTDGTNVATLPNMSADGKLMVSTDSIVIPAIPDSSTWYTLTIKKVNGVVTPMWTAVDNAVYYVETSSATLSLDNIVMYQSGSSAQSLSLVYYV